MRWGIVGSGAIASQFARDAKFAPGARAVGVCSRLEQRAAAFAQAHGIPEVYGDLDAMLACSDIQNVYVGVPHTAHLPVALKCMQAGKNVLCEKPLAVNASDAKKMMEQAELSGVTLMDAMWTRCFPAMRQLREWIHGGLVGEVQNVTVDMGYNSILQGEDKSWRHQNAHAGGSLLDLGVYCVYLALDIFGAESLGEVRGLARIEDGVDKSNAFIMDFGGRLFTATTSIINESPCSAALHCEKGNVLIPASWWCPNALEFTAHGGQKQRLEFPYDAQGMQYEIMAFEQAIEQGEKQCPLTPHADTLKVMQIMDGLRRDWGLRYPQDK